VLAVWLFLVLAVVGLLITQTPRISTSLTLNNTPSQRVLDDIAAALPEAAGSQGTLAFTAADGGRVDTPERADAISHALQLAIDSGIVVDRAAAQAAQDTQLEQTIRARVEAKVATELSTQIEAMATKLQSAKQSISTRVAAAPAAQREQLVALGAQVDGILATANSLLAAPDADRVAGAAALFSDVKLLSTKMAALGMTDSGLSLPSSSLTDPSATVNTAVTDAMRTAQANLSALTRGTNPQGTELVTSQGTLSSVLVSADGTTAVMSLQLKKQISDLPTGSLDNLLATVGKAVGTQGMQVAASSSLQPLQAPISGDEAIGLGVAAIVLFLTLGSLVVAGLPILTALIGVFLGVGGVYALSANFVMTTSTPALGLMLGLAVGIDYALFIVHKQRSLRARLGLDPIEATARAVATAGGAVLFAGVTVIIALLGLLTLGMGFVTTMGLTAAVTVALAVALALSALPALLGLIGTRGKAPRQDQGEPGHSIFERAATRWVHVVTARPLVTIGLVVVALLGLAVPALNLNLGMPSGAVAQPGSGARIAYDAVTRTLGEGANAPLVVALAPASGVSADQNLLKTWQTELASRPDVSNVQLMGSAQDGSLVLYTVTPDAGPTSLSTGDLVRNLRGATLDKVDTVGVTGLTALNIDLSEALAAAIPLYLGLVALLSLVILLLVFRSVVVPLAATGGFLLSIGATLGLVVTVFSHPDFTWVVGMDRAGPVLSFLPIMATGILYGLAMDYQVFLSTSIREEHVHGASARRAVADGFQHASRVVVAAAVIMVSVFGGFILSEDTTIRQFGFALSAGILIDAFVIRMTLIPAVLHLSGERAWWLPRRLARFLPEVDVEGERLKVTPAADNRGETRLREPAEDEVAMGGRP
jgi:RND superfamily putative drug exporter